MIVDEHMIDSAYTVDLGGVLTGRTTQTAGEQWCKNDWHCMVDGSGVSPWRKAE